LLANELDLPADLHVNSLPSVPDVNAEVILTRFAAGSPK